MPTLRLHRPPRHSLLRNRFRRPHPWRLLHQPDDALGPTLLATIDDGATITLPLDPGRYTLSIDGPKGRSGPLVVRLPTRGTVDLECGLLKRNESMGVDLVRRLVDATALPNAPYFLRARPTPDP